MRRWISGALAKAREQGVTVAVENMPANRPGILRVRPGSAHLPEHLADAGDVTLDTSHAGASRLDLLSARAALAPQLRHVHLSDSNLVVGKDEHRLPGKGRLPLRPFLAALAADGYPGAVSLELKPWPLGAPDPAELDAMRRFIAFTVDTSRVALALARAVVVTSPMTAMAVAPQREASGDRSTECGSRVLSMPLQAAYSTSRP